ncbi:hypothetical protein P22_0642 [Propionispora sp. 2/2-37]|uniref:hypothetical protein n=1 Tax=Propionispora sp. 2/2-37 TaxID=1677858 RepID=UPI0006BB8711|nr:hypothetical protein [Propionispora sp. 2/2-37]CUH94576.1 hypothetical protein P22_0642 [Propionispora sp. 2/2-37]
MKIRKVRDLTLVDIGQGKTMVIACDSCGGAGLKDGDTLKVSPVVTGKYTARVVLLEILCAGAEVVCLANAVCNEMEPTGKGIIQGIEEELALAGIDQVVLTGSTEENFPTIATGLGITAVGLAESSRLKVNTCRDGAAVLAIGKPRVGQEVLQARLIDYATVTRLAGLKNVYELLPVGSQGILAEIRQLAALNGLTFVPAKKIAVDMQKSAGPSTVVLAVVKKCFLEQLPRLNETEVIGELVNRQ